MYEIYILSWLSMLVWSVNGSNSIYFSGIYKLNCAFVANLFNKHPGLDSSNIDLEDYANVEESREEKTYR